MDPATGLVLSVIGLFPLCVDGFTIITKCFAAPIDVRNAVMRIEWQKYILMAWGEHWGIKESSSNSKLATYLNSGTGVGPGVLSTLAAISDTFADTDNLVREYGLKFEKKNQDLRNFEFSNILGGAGFRNVSKQKLKSRKAHMSLLKRCKFTLKDSKGFERLTLKLVECIGNLDKMCSWQLALTIHRGVLQVLDEEKNPRVLVSLSKSASEMSRVKEEAGERHAGYDLFASITAFKAKLARLDRIGTVISYTTSDFSYGKSAWEISDGDATMAITRENSQDAGVRLIEWYNYEGSVTSRRRIEHGIIELAKVLCIAERPREFRTLTCAGLIPDHANSRYGFVFVPPDYIENITKFPLQVGALSKNRKPISLLELYEKNVDSKGAPGILDLGIRFQLAKKIVHSIYVMHAVGWVHKNIRSSSGKSKRLLSCC